MTTCLVSLWDFYLKDTGLQVPTESLALEIGLGVVSLLIPR
jgi:hypothetical protein